LYRAQDGTAAAEVLLTMYMTKSGAEEGKKKVKVCRTTFTVTAAHLKQNGGSARDKCRFAEFHIPGNT
jgi:tryptophanase